MKTTKQTSAAELTLATTDGEKRDWSPAMTNRNLPVGKLTVTTGMVRWFAPRGVVPITKQTVANPSSLCFPFDRLCLQFDSERSSEWLYDLQHRYWFSLGCTIDDPSWEATVRLLNQQSAHPVRGMDKTVPVGYVNLLIE